ncbi:MAG: hypothetical protein D6778_10685 [Nitrospirae bacterium]|nr:MAG: hypothetical protein D6778_10685 [Nitrospirota bacterium]
MKVGPAGEGLTISLSPQRALTLKKGDILKARVLRVFNDHEVLLKIGKEQILARSTLPLKDGQALTLRVTETGQTLLLQVIGGTNPKGLLEGLRAALEALPLKLEEIKSLESVIKEKTEEVLLHLHEQARSGRPEAKEVLQRLALLQEEAIKQGFLVIPLPVQNEDLREALLFWRKKGNKEEMGTSQTVIVKLTLHTYGGIMALFDLAREGLSIKVFVEDRGLYKSLQSDKKSLRERLLSTGLDLRGLEFYQGQSRKDLGFVSQRI